MALLCLLAGASTRRGIPLTAVHIGHGLRGQTAFDDARIAADLSTSLGLPFLYLSIDVPSGRRPGESPEAAARRLRYGALLAAAAGTQTQVRIATGHTLDDQAETVLMNLARHGGRSRGGIRQRRPDGVIRPILPFRRTELRAYLASIGVAWREDETNRDERLLRNRIRLSTLPSLETAMPGIAVRLARAGAAWTGRLDALDARIDASLREVLAPLEGPWPRSLFRSLGAEGALRLLVRACGARGGVPGGVQLRRTAARLLSEVPRLSGSLAGLRIVSDARAVRMSRRDDPA